MRTAGVARPASTNHRRSPHHLVRRLAEVQPRELPDPERPSGRDEPDRPSPAPPYEVQQYKEWHKRRLEAHPGITGLWQVAGRNHLSFEEMVKLDLEYIENWSIEMDAHIFVKTIPVVLFGRAY
jgi:hypothetical protein